jgi:DNA-binding NarL/FixJ family response regulator
VALRLVFADDSYLMRAGTAALLDEVAELSVVAVVEDPAALLRAVEQHEPDVVLTDIRMPPTYGREGIVAALEIRRRHPRTGVVVLSQYVEDGYAVELLSDGLGGIGYLLKERVAQLDQLVGALLSVAGGGSVLDPLVVESLLSRARGREADPVDTLSPREREVLRSMASGKSNGAIGRELYLSERAVEKNVNGIFTKLGLNQEADVNRRVRAVVTYLEASAGT